MQKVIETKTYIINYSDSLKQLVDETIKLLDKKINEYKELFNIQNNEIVKVNYFDNKEEFRNFIYDIRKEKESLPKYATATYDDGMINAYINEEKQLERLYTASHELFHIFYMQYILENDYSKRIVWYDEGMAQFMSGEKDKIKNDDEFKKYYLKVKEETKEIPNLNDLLHGESFCNDNYNGYDLSYLSIKYLSEILEVNEFKNLMSDFSKIKNYGNNLLTKMFSYYDKKYNI